MLLPGTESQENAFGALIANWQLRLWCETVEGFSRPYVQIRLKIAKIGNSIVGSYKFGPKPRKDEVSSGSDGKTMNGI